jgi:hypothetical protein
MDSPLETKDVPWADYLNVFPYAFTVTPTCLPPASVIYLTRSSNNCLPGPQAAISISKPCERRLGTLNKDRCRLLGHPYLIDSKIAVTNDATQLLCGATYKAKYHRMTKG